MRLGFSHSKSTILLGIIQVLFIVAVTFARDLNDNYVLPGIVVVTIILSVILDSVIRNRVTKENTV
jgi:hypothetical protein